MAKQTELEVIRGKDSRELLYDLTTARKDLFHARLQMESEGGRPSDIANLKKKIARILTVLGQRDEAEGDDAEADAGKTSEESVTS
jgi:ribosomal protein L29